MLAGLAAATLGSTLSSAARGAAANAASTRPAQHTNPAAINSVARRALMTSDLLYLTPLHKSGKESRCHAEVWFVERAGVVYIVTADKAWRARAINIGLPRARIWVGDFGPWQKATERFRSAPTFVGQGARVTDASEITSVLDLYGDKYRLQWLLWKGRFRDGLKSGSRVMLRYTAAS